MEQAKNKLELFQSYLENEREILELLEKAQPLLKRREALEAQLPSLTSARIAEIKFPEPFKKKPQTSSSSQGKKKESQLDLDLGTSSSVSSSKKRKQELSSPGESALRSKLIELGSTSTAQTPRRVLDDSDTFQGSSVQ